LGWIRGACARCTGEVFLKGGSGGALAWRKQTD
jgi:hypothetical protein